MNQMSLLKDIIFFGIWTGLWGIGDNIINLYVPMSDYKRRIKTFIVIYIASLFLLYMTGGMTIIL
ncbi:hypothetical protein QKU48_gp1387 [Fadolivirus algeromassiliense]|jgi:hypothetical protein|uniref:Uncharacterized protein n=1 Tax=Fadolivirus FV1/VV64 TaxID=3070911 RepID=A0A7D3QV94_9VIRU|nr:hypothetical protein QKU48_gp1387 [Fadolivirus algeromassiliense]QKF94845.1 hypothetical protein Fadolivirus_1_1387 [Fadolivirus FV1/VV64]